MREVGEDQGLALDLRGTPPWRRRSSPGSRPRPRRRGCCGRAPARPCRAGSCHGVIHGRLRVGDDRRDLGELLVLLLGDAGVGGEDEVGRELRDLLDRRAVGVVVPHRRLGARAPRSPRRTSPTSRRRCRPRSAWSAPTGTTPSASAASWSVQPRVATRVRLLLDRGLAEGVLDGHGEGVGVDLRGRSPASGASVASVEPVLQPASAEAPSATASGQHGAEASHHRGSPRGRSGLLRAA